MGLDHVTVTVDDLSSAVRFFDAALLPLRVTRLVDYEDPEDEDEAGVEVVGYGTVQVQLWVVTGSPPTAGVHLAFAATDRKSVDASYEAAVAAGGRGRRPPRSWGIYRPGRYSAMTLDRYGNVIEAFVDESPADAEGHPRRCAAGIDRGAPDGRARAGGT